ncbi:MAG TPA: CoA-binding protein, partial [Acetobacteraceae bacterium]|nr:CoA-binding protein [Acetobacteraceae bacterium]
MKRTSVYHHADLTRLLHPASVAVIGASTRAGSFGERVLHNLQHYGGRVYPVNARYERIGEHRCYPDVAALPEVPDCAVITAAREAVEEIVLDCARAGVGGVIIFASGYSYCVTHSARRPSDGFVRNKDIAAMHAPKFARGGYARLRLSSACDVAN